MTRVCALPWLMLLALPVVAVAQTTVYRCKRADGSVSFQDAPCPHNQHQRTLTLQAPPPARSVPVPTPAPAPAAKAPPPADTGASRQRMPPPQLYQCRRATDGTTYVSRNGQPGAYLAPSGMLSYAQPLSDAYGGRGGGGASAPELNRGRITPGMIGSRYVWVQDQCRPMSFGEICAHLQKAYDANEAKLRNAFRSDRGPFEKREKQLRSEMEACTP